MNIYHLFIFWAVNLVLCLLLITNPLMVKNKRELDLAHFRLLHPHIVFVL